MQWAGLKDIDDVEPVNESDFECLEEVRAVLGRWGRLERFGVALLHKHFDMEPDEVLVEYSDPVSRELFIRPVKAEQAGRTVGTIWMLRDGAREAMLGCRQYCGTDVQGNHNSFHKMT